MKIYKTQKEIEADIKDRVLAVEGDVKFECSFAISASIKVAGNIDARNIDAWHINAGNINAGNIDAWDINARDINAGNINAGDINAGDIDAGNIDARNIDAWHINAWDISFCAVAFAYVSFKCKSIVGRRRNNRYFCLDGEVQIVKDDDKKAQLRSKADELIAKANELKEQADAL